MLMFTGDRQTKATVSLSMHDAELRLCAALRPDGCAAELANKFDDGQIKQTPGKVVP